MLNAAAVFAELAGGLKSWNFLNLLFVAPPPSHLGLSEWEDDRILAAVLAASQQEYIDSLRLPRTPPPPSEHATDEEHQ